uniref:Uncharacterized protein n=1 Tax=viral metagenome TaxID=1070528 RepID=A0A6C0CP42_9ZZZZ
MDKALQKAQSLLDGPTKKSANGRESTAPAKDGQTGGKRKHRRTAKKHHKKSHKKHHKKSHKKHHKKKHHKKHHKKSHKKRHKKKGGSVLAKAALPFGLLALQKFFQTRKGKKDLHKATKTLRKTAKKVSKSVRRAL